MKGSLRPEKIHVYITIFGDRENGRQLNMCDAGADKKRRVNDSNKFICSVCLNNRHADDAEEEIARLRTESCPVCRRHFDSCQSHVTRKPTKDKNTVDDLTSTHSPKGNRKVQATQTEVAQGLSLLNEVLNVFQNHKSEETKFGNGKSSRYKDAGMVTDGKDRLLTVCNLYQFSVTDDKSSLKNFVVLDSKCTEKPKVEPVICLIKQKSSSIPQMKIDEIKFSLKEKTKSKDAIDEVNRMFATVRKSDLNDALDSTNRPMLSNAPRVLPVAKSKKSHFHSKDTHKSDDKQKGKCRCGHRSNIFYLSGGDGSPRTHKCCGGKIDIPYSPKISHFQQKSKFVCHCENGNTRPFVCCPYYKTPTCCHECRDRETFRGTNGHANHLSIDGHLCPWTLASPEGEKCVASWKGIGYLVESGLIKSAVD
ncbi:hypothetical protein EVAR_5310_1 [Eumeta japonica]|uniref:Uncharacterized protein n=1 Tax=Eumeta variegata TaxID=151549 RepID=A0A4C1TM72_EUMVA|nr:hypothetical protein EVAR_5310_1 [Eumeta japonica]